MSPVDVEKYSTRHANVVRRRVLEAFEKANGFRPNSYELEAICFNTATFGGPIKHEYLLNLFRFSWPEQILLESNGYENFWAKRIAKAFCEYRKIIAMGCGSSGKSKVFAACILKRWEVQPWKTSAYLSSTSKEDLEARIWGYVRELHEVDTYKIGSRLDYRNTIVLEEDKQNKERDYRDSITGIAIKEGSEGSQAVKKVSGRHNQSVIWCCDEFPHMNIDILSGRTNMRLNSFSQFIAIGNKPREGDPLYIDAEPYGDEYPDGWKSVTPDMDEWKIKGGICLYFDGERSPNHQAPEGEKTPFPGMIDREMIRLVVDEDGYDSPGWWEQVKGFPQTGEIQDTVLNGKLLEEKGAHEQPVWGAQSIECVAGLDLGFRADGDPCVADFARIGPASDGRMIAAFESDAHPVVPKLSEKTPFETQISTRFLEMAKERDCHCVAVDVTGDGGIIAQELDKQARAQRYALEIVLVSFSGTADPDITYESGGKKKPARDIFDRKVSELWYSLRLSVQNGVIRGMVPNSNAVKQLCGRKVIQDEKKRWSIEKKKDYKKRLRRSPDHGDARVLAHHMASRKGLSGSGRSASLPKPATWEDVMQKPKPTPGRYGWGHGAPSRYSR